MLVLALVAYLFCYAVYLSLTRKYVGMPPVFVGLENYVRLDLPTPSSERAVANSFIFTGTSVAVKLFLGLGDGPGADLADPVAGGSWTGRAPDPRAGPTVVYPRRR